MDANRDGTIVIYASPYGYNIVYRDGGFHFDGGSHRDADGNASPDACAAADLHADIHADAGAADVDTPSAVSATL